MSQFLTPLQVEEIDDSTWRLLSPLEYQSDLVKRTITVPKDFVTDFASVPRWLPTSYALLGDTAHAAAVVHDWLYTSHQFDRQTADAILREAALASGVSSWRSSLLYAGVRVGGQGPYNADATKQPEVVKQELEKYEDSVTVYSRAGA